jgi:hypothetical protein
MSDFVANYFPVEQISQEFPYNKTGYYHSKYLISNWNGEKWGWVLQTCQSSRFELNNAFVLESQVLGKDTFQNTILMDPSWHYSRGQMVIWSECTSTAGFSQLVRFFNWNQDYFAIYHHSDWFLNYPFYFTINYVFESELVWSEPRSKEIRKWRIWNKSIIN